MNAAADLARAAQSSGLPGWTLLYLVPLYMAWARSLRRCSATPGGRRDAILASNLLLGRISLLRTWYSSGKDRQHRAKVLTIPMGRPSGARTAPNLIRNPHG